MDTDMGSPDARAYADGFTWVFRQAGWVVNNPMFMGLVKVSPSGLIMAVTNPNSLTPSEVTVARAFADAGIRFDVDAGRFKDQQMDDSEVVELLFSNRQEV
jgi:hypothetical protein